MRLAAWIFFRQDDRQDVGKYLQQNTGKKGARPLSPWEVPLYSTSHCAKVEYRSTAAKGFRIEKP